MQTPRCRGRLLDESGSMLIELLIAMLFLSIAVGALISTYSSSILSLRRTSIDGNALTLADRQIELYNTLPYASIAIASSTIPSGSDPYVTAHSADPTIPSSTGQVTGGTVGTGSCAGPTSPQPGCAVQTVTGPDGRTYRIDTYIVYVTPATTGSRQVKQVTTLTRLIEGGTVGAITARIQSAYDQCNPPSTTAGSTC